MYGQFAFLYENVIKWLCGCCQLLFSSQNQCTPWWWQDSTWKQMLALCDRHRVVLCEVTVTNFPVCSFFYISLAPSVNTFRIKVRSSGLTFCCQIIARGGLDIWEGGDARLKFWIKLLKETNRSWRGPGFFDAQKRLYLEHVKHLFLNFFTWSPNRDLNGSIWAIHDSVFPWTS